MKLPRLMQRILAAKASHGAGEAAPPADPHFVVERKAGAVRLFRFRGDHARLTQVLFDVVRQLPEPIGVILVEYLDRPHEWVNAEVPRTLILEADRGSRHGTVVRVMSLARELGWEKMAIAAQPDPDN